MKHIRLLVAIIAVVMVLAQGEVFLADEWVEDGVFIGFEDDSSDIAMEDDSIELQGVGNSEETDISADGEIVDIYNEWIEDNSVETIDEDLIDEFDISDEEVFDIWEDITEVIEDSEEFFEDSGEGGRLRVVITAKDRANNQGLPSTFRIKDANGAWIEDASGEPLWAYDGLSELIVELPGYLEEITVVQIEAETDYMIEGNAEHKRPREQNMTIIQQVWQKFMLISATIQRRQ